MPHLSPPRSATSDSLPHTSQQCWQSSRRAIAIALVSLALGDRPALAQSSIEADTTMGNQPSRVIQNYFGFPVEVITDGAQRGQNLFHSLRDFNVDPGRSAYFVVPNNAVRNIVTRVTGNNLSNISGFLGTFRELPNGGVQIAIPNVNLFLINPNGIIFGSGARLAVGGSFVATTANALQFESLGDFSASQPIPPNELLTINPSAFLFNQLVQQPQNSIESRALLVVPEGRSLLLLGGNTAPTKTASGNILLAGNGIREETGLVASGGRVEVGSVGSVGTVQLLSNGDSLSFKMGDTTARTDISLTNSVGIAVWKSNGGGNLVIDGRNISLSGGSFAVAGILPGGSSPANRAGDVLITATETLNLDNESFIFNRVIPNALGQSGNILITAENLSVRGGSQISTSTLGQGNAGDVSVIVRETTVFDGENSSGTSISQAGSSVQPGAAGHAGNLTLTTKNLFLTNGAQLAARTFGQGNAGNLIVTVQETAFFDGTNRAVTSASGIGSTVEPKAIGNGGNTLLTAKNVFVTNGAQILAGTFGQGNAGNLTITVQELAAFDGENQNGITSQAGSGVQPGATGNGGNFNLTARNLLVTNGAGLAASTFGQGNGGSLTITVQETATFDGSTRDGTASSGASSTVEPGATGNGGNFTLATNNLTVTNGAELSVSTFGQGHAGDLTIAVNETASFDGTSRTGTVSSAARSSVESKAVGNGGDLTLHAKNLFVLSGAQLNVSTFGQGNAGNLRITAQQSALFEGTTPSGTVASAAVSAVEPGAIGNGRTIQLSARQLTIKDGAVLSSESRSLGSAGNLVVTADQVTLDKGELRASTLFSDGGNITVNVQELLLLRRGSLISTSAGLAEGGGSGGNITINAPRGFLVTALNENNDITANAFNGSGGRVTVNAQGIYGFTVRSRADLARLLGTNDPTKLDPRLLPTNDITAISQGSPNLSGTVALNTPDVDPSRGLQQLPQNVIETSRILANSCIVRRRGEAQSSFLITGNGGLPERPGSPSMPSFPTGDVQPIPDERSPRALPTTTLREIDGIYQLPSGEVILSWQCGDR